MHNSTRQGVASYVTKPRGFPAYRDGPRSGEEAGPTGTAADLVVAIGWLCGLWMFMVINDVKYNDREI